MMRYLRLFRLRFLLSLSEAMHDRVDFCIETFAQLIVVSINLTFFTLIYQHISTLGGYSYEQALLILGFYQLMDGLSNLILRNNLRHISKYVRLGEFDSMLTQPLDLQLNLIRRFAVSQFGIIASGLLLIGYVTYALHLSLGTLFLALVLSQSLGFLLHWSVMFAVTTLGFWLIKMDHLAHLGQVIVDLGKFPIGALGEKVGNFFTFVIPLVIVATIPTELLFDAPVWYLVGIAAIVILALFALSRVFFFWALRSYSSVSG
ncbi:ABC-2 family transporter protein [Candidatus Berkelbacteria bacterium]|nr:ABC-2 family transporter protein [Candidatus Berkelbacteria bacterium]